MKEEDKKKSKLKKIGKAGLYILKLNPLLMPFFTSKGLLKKHNIKSFTELANKLSKKKKDKKLKKVSSPRSRGESLKKGGKV